MARVAHELWLTDASQAEPLVSLPGEVQLVDEEQAARGLWLKDATQALRELQSASIQLVHELP